MTTLLFIFALLTTPTDRYICDLWTNAITRDGVIVACGVDLLAGLRVDVYNLDMQFICARDAVYLNNTDELLATCDVKQPLDNYVLRIVQPGYNSIMCYVMSEHEDKPTAEEIAAQCPRAKTESYVIEFAGTKSPEEDQSFTCPPRVLTPGFGLYDQPLNEKDLLTADDLTWLAGQLIWSGQVKPTCTPSVNPDSKIATPCGMAAARENVIKWQNQFDADIYKSAVAYSVPAKLLKRVLMRESQFWPFYRGADYEIGVMQITDNGLDTLLRFDAAIDPDYFDRGELGRLWSRSVTRDTLYCHGCTLLEAIDHTKKNMDLYARLLAAFHCRAVTINPALTGDAAWRQSIVDYNGSAEYLTRIEQ